MNKSYTDYTDFKNRLHRFFRDFGVFQKSLITLLIVVSILYSRVFAQEVAKNVVEYTSGDLRDPLKSPWEVMIVPPELEPTEDIFLPEEFVVQGMVWGTEPVRAIINEEVAGIGDTILGVQVLDIRKEGVYLLYKGKEFIVKPQ